MSDRRAFRRSFRGAAACAAIACIFLFGCNNFSLVGLLDTPSESAPSTLKLVPDAANILVNGTRQFTAIGGAGGYSYTVQAEGAGGSIDPSGLYTAPTNPGTDTIVVTDSAGATCESTAMVTLSVSLAITPVKITLVAGATVTFTAIGGKPPYTYSASGGSINSTGVFTAPTIAGAYTVHVTDGALNTADAIVTVIAKPAALQISPTSLFLVTGGQTTFSATGGMPPYSYSVMTGGAGGIVNSVSGLYTAPGLEGSDTVRVTDAGSRTSDASVSVYFPLTIVPTDATVQQGDIYSFAASGGVPGAGYVYSQVPGGVGTTDLDGTYHASSAGPATVKVVDSVNNSSTATVTVTTPVPPWTIQSIDTAARSGQYASLALSSTGVPQIAYYESKNKELRLETWNGTASAWTRQTVDNTTRTVGQYASLALDAGANARISYYDATNKRLRFASWNGSSWTRQTVDSVGDVGMYSSLALDSSGNPHISYYDNTKKYLKYASWNGSSWTKQIVDSGADVGMYSSLALDSSGNPHISYYDNTKKYLKYASGNGAPPSWSTQTVDSVGDVGMYSSLALDSSGNPHISYYDNTNKYLKYASGNGAPPSWSTQTVDNGGDVGMYSSLALDSSGNPHISYYDAVNKHLKYASGNGAPPSWSTQTVDTSNNVGSYSSLKLDPKSDKPRIAYYNSSSLDLKYAKE